MSGYREVIRIPQAGPGRAASLFLAAFLAIVLARIPLAAQVPTGSIEGTVTDASGAGIPGANVTVTQKSRGRVFTTTTDASGGYAVSALEPADYVVQVEAAHFKKGVLELRVEVGKAATGNLRLELGPVEESIRVEATQETQIDVNRNTVGGLVTPAQMENLPVDGRNFLELASLEPGVQVVDAGGLEMTKTGFTAVSVAGGEGRTTRIQVDGVDITDEVVGTTTQNFSLDAVEGFQISQFTLDPSTSLSNTGAINVTTRSGTNDPHAEGYLFWRDHNFAARIGGRDAPFHRLQGGFRAGGPAVKDKAFWFLNYEKTGQHNGTLVEPPSPFGKYAGFVVTPFTENLGTGRLDWNAGSRVHVFARFTHDDNQGVTRFGGPSLSPVLNKNNTNSVAAGADISLSRVTHSFRYGRLNFADYVNPSQPPGIPAFPMQILFDDTNVSFGPNFLSRQHSLQTNDQFRYDGSLVLHGQVLQYGVNYAHISASLFGAAFSLAPFADTFTRALAGPDPTNPLNYVPVALVFGNGLGFFSTEPNHGFPLGGITNDRFAIYVADSWKALRDVTFNAGLRWEVDPGQVNHDVVRPAILDSVVPGQSGRVPIDRDNFGPTFGFAWNVAGRDTTVIRAGTGLYYETNIFENVLFDRANFLPVSVAPQFPVLNSIVGFNQLTGPSPSCPNIFNFNSVAGQPLAASLSSILAAEATFQADTAMVAGTPSGPPAITPACGQLPGTQNTVGPIFDRHFTQPYSLHSNVGIQRRLGKNWLLQADFVRNRAVHVYLPQERNRVGAANNFNAANAQIAINTTVAACGQTTVDQAIMSCPGLHPGGGGANITDFSLFGLGSGFAFPGNNPNFGQLMMIGTQGLSLYRGLQVKLTGRAEHFTRFFRSASWGFAYALSRFEASQSDQANVLNQHAFSNDCATCFFGPVGGDRTHQLSVNSLFELPFGFRWNTVTHIGSAIPVTLQVPTGLGGPAEIFASDLDGEGTTNDILPGTNIGSYARSIPGPSQLNTTINNYNQKFAGTFTPAGQALVTSGLLTPLQLAELGGVIQPIANAPAGAVGIDWFWTTDFRLAKVFRAHEHFQIEPTVDAFNVFNRINFDPIDNPLSGMLSGAPGTVNGTTRHDQPGCDPINNPGPCTGRKNFFGLRTGSFSPGIPRALQFGVRMRF